MIELPCDWRVRAVPAITILLFAALVAWLPTAWPWRLAGLAATLLLGVVALRHGSRRRPLALIVEPNRGLRCRLAAGEEFAVARVEATVVRPWLVAARLYDGAGRATGLLVPGAVLAPRMHWRLRRALIGFRSPVKPLAGGAADGVAQPSGRLGT